MNKFHYLFHFFTYNIAWITCMMLAARGFGTWAAIIVMLITLLQILWQFKINKVTYGLFQLTALLTLVGTCVDSFFVRSSFIILASNPFSHSFTSPWMISIWINFSVLLFSTLSRLFAHYYLLSLASFFGFGIAYAIGGKMGAATFPYGYLTCVMIGATWAILMPFCIYIYQGMLRK